MTRLERLLGIALLEMQNRHGRTPRATVLFYLSVDDLAAEEVRLKGAGICYQGRSRSPTG